MLPKTGIILLKQFQIQFLKFYSKAKTGSFLRFLENFTYTAYNFMI